MNDKQIESAIDQVLESQDAKIRFSIFYSDDDYESDYAASDAIEADQKKIKAMIKRSGLAGLSFDVSGERSGQYMDVAFSVAREGRSNDELCTWLEPMLRALTDTIMIDGEEWELE